MSEYHEGVEIHDGRPDDGYKPFQLIGVIVISLLGFAAFFLSFLLAPLAILAVFYFVFAASDRSKRSNGNGHDVEPAPPEPPPTPVLSRPADGRDVVVAPAVAAPVHR